jgi:hypothetical protein
LFSPAPLSTLDTLTLGDAVTFAFGNEEASFSEFGFYAIPIHLFSKSTQQTIK